MSKELEALEEAKELTHRLITSGSWDKIEEQLNIVEVALKDYEKITGGDFHIEPINVHIENQKQIKALEIIKEKNVFVWGFIHKKEEIEGFEQTYDYYKTHFGYFHSGYAYELLTQEEFNLVKEVLL